MAPYRFATLLAAESAATAGTKTIDLDVVDPISMIQIVQKATSAGTTMAAHPAANISKIELVDGSDVLASLSGRECQALDFYDKKVMPVNFITDTSSVMTYCTFNLNFGRWLRDPVLALDPTKFRNPQLKITHNYQTCDTSASASTLAAYAYMFDTKKITPMGFLSAKEQKTYTCGASATIEQTDLPRDHILRRLMVVGRGNDYFPWQVANKIKLSENGGKSVPYDFSTSDWLKLINQAYPRCVEPAQISVNATARDAWAAPSFEVAWQLMPQAVTNIISQESASHAMPFALDITASDVCTGRVEGWCPHSAFPIDFGDPQNVDDWYDVTGMTSLKLEVTAGTAGTSGTVDILTQQLRKY